MELFKFFSKSKQSKNIAKERLKLVLIQDRNNISPGIMGNIKSSIAEAISKYMEIEESGIDIKLSRSKKDELSKPVSELVINIPIINIKEDMLR